MIPVIQDWHRIALKEVVYQAEQENWAHFNAELETAEDNLRKKESRMKSFEQPEELVMHEWSPVSKQNSPEKKALIPEGQWLFQSQETPIKQPASNSLIREVMAPFFTASEFKNAESLPEENVLRLAQNQKLIQKQMVLEEGQFQAWLDEVVNVARYIQKGEMKHLAFQLNPKDLGQMDVFVSEEEGSLAVHIFAESEDTRNQIKKQLPELLAQLESLYQQNLKVKILPRPQSTLFKKLTQTGTSSGDDSTIKAL